MNKSLPTRNWLIPAIALFALAAANAARAESVLRQIPSDAVAVGLVNNIEQANREIRAAAEKLGLDRPDLLQLTKLRGAEKGLNEQGMLAFAAFVRPSDLPFQFSALAYVPVRDYAAFVEQFGPEDAAARITTITIDGEQRLVGQRGDYAVLAQPRDEELLKKSLAAEENVAAAFEALGEWPARHSAVWMVSRRGIEYAMREATKGLAMFRAAMAEQELPESQWANIDMVFAGYERFFRLAEQELTHFALGVRVDESVNLHVTSRSLVREQGDLSQRLAEFPPLAEHPLAGLPAVPFAMALGGPLSEKLAADMTEFSMSMLRAMPGGEELTDEQLRKAVELSTDSMKGMKSMAMLIGVGKPGDSLYGDAYFLMRTQDSKQFLADYEKSIRGLAKLGQDTGHPWLAGYKVQRIEAAGQAGLKLSMEIPAGAFGFPDDEAFRKLMFGDQESLDVYMAAATRDSVVGVYVSRQNLDKAIAAAGDKGLAAEPPIVQLDELLLEGAQWRIYFHPRGMAQWFSNMAAAALGPELAIEPPPLPDSPVPLAIKASAGGVETDLVLPSELLEAAGKFFQSFQRPGE